MKLFYCIMVSLLLYIERLNITKWYLIWGHFISVEIEPWNNLIILKMIDIINYYYDLLTLIYEVDDEKRMYHVIILLIYSKTYVIDSKNWYDFKSQKECKSRKKILFFIMTNDNK